MGTVPSLHPLSKALSGEVSLGGPSEPAARPESWGVMLLEGCGEPRCCECGNRSRQRWPELNLDSLPGTNKIELALRFTVEINPPLTAAEPVK